MSLNLIADALANNRSLPQIIEGAVMRTEMRREASVIHTMDKLLYEVFVEFAMTTGQENNVKFLFDVCQYRHLCKLAHNWSKTPNKSEEKKILQVLQTDDFRCYFVLWLNTLCLRV